MTIRRENLILSSRMMNFILGIILITASLVFMFTIQSYRNYPHIEPVLILMTGFFSLMAAFTVHRKTSFKINLFLGSFHILIGLSLGIFLVNELEWFLNPVFGFSSQDVILNIILGIIFLWLAYFFEHKRIPHTSRLKA